MSETASMETIRTIADLRSRIAEARARGLRIGLVPTMGFLHDGHLALIEESKRRCDLTVVSIFVNPTQFSPSEDFASYPRDFGRDEELCRAAGVAFVFSPDSREVYPDGFETFVDAGSLGAILCGAFRPTHFRGVATVVTKLFNIVRPDVAFFGQKDLQQCAVLRRVARDLDVPLEIAIVPTVREPDGLAMSSRNRYLDPGQRRRAGCLPRALSAARDAYERGERNSASLVKVVREGLTDVDQVQYVEVVELENFGIVTGDIEAHGAICVAAYVGETRLIDNILLGTGNPDSVLAARQD